MFTLANMFDQLFTWLYYKLIDCLSEFQKYLGNMGAEIFDDENIQAILLFFQMFSSALLVVGLAVGISEYAINSGQGRGSIKDASLNFGKAMMADALFTTVPVKLYQLSITVENLIANAMNPAHTEAAQSAGTDLFSKIKDFFLNMIAQNVILQVSGSVTGSGDGSGMHVPAITDLLFLIAFCYGFFKVLFGNLKRGTILLIQICVCPFYIFSMALGYSDGFTGWCKQIAGLCFTVFLQNLLLTVGLLLFRDHIIIGTGIMLAAAEVPRIAGRYGLDTSAKASMAGVSNAASTTMAIVRVLAHV